MATIDWGAENARAEAQTPRERLARAIDLFGDDLLFTSSFGAGSGVLLHLWSLVARARPVVFVDTGFLFPETIAYRDRLSERLGLTIEVVRPARTREAFTKEFGANVYEADPDFCCAENKVAPLAAHVARARGWVSGLRRDQGETRALTPIFAPQDDGPVKVHPIATMRAAEVKAYLADHDVPEHPLVARRYLSIGCAPCTLPIAEGAPERAGRWAGKAKTECGLHVPLGARRDGPR